MYCKCGKPVLQAIEGELVCQDCWDRSQMSAEDIEESKQIAWFRSHCAGCEKKVSRVILDMTGGYCVVCDKENQACA